MQSQGKLSESSKYLAFARNIKKIEAKSKSEKDNKQNIMSELIRTFFS